MDIAIRWHAVQAMAANPRGDSRFRETRMKTTIGSAVCCLLLVGCLSGTTLSAEVGTNGRRSAGPDASNPLTCVILPADALPVERHAADELAHYVAKMIGRRLPVLVEGADRPAGRALVVGRTAVNLKAHKVDDWPQDTIYIGYGAGDIAIVGQGSQGTLFAAHEFLRDQGCRWYMPLTSGEHIPRRKRLNLPAEPRHHTPSFVERGWWPAPSFMGTSPGIWKVYYYPWAARNGLNTVTAGMITTSPAQYGHGYHTRKGHTLIALIPSGDHPRRAEVFAAHPEWYPLVNGKRVYEYKDGRPVQACLSKMAVAEEVARHAIEYFRKNPECRRFSVAHNDEPSYWCECADCLAMDGPHSTWRVNDKSDAYGRRSKSGLGPMSDRYVTFVNRVARIVDKECPGKCVSFYAYGSATSPPRRPDWTLEPNVIVEYCYGDGICLRHALDDRTCQANADFTDWLVGWASRGNPVVVYDYPPSGDNCDVPSGFTRRYKHYVSHCKRLGVTGWGGGDPGVPAGAGLYHYIKARLLWDVEADVDELIEEFCRDMYGAAGDTMRQLYETLERRLRELTGHTIWGSWIRQLEPSDLDELEGLLAKAEGLAKAPAAAKHVAMMRVAMNNLTLARMEADEATQNDPDLYERYARLCAETLTLRTQINEPVPMIMTTPWENKLKGAYRPPFEAMAGKELLTLPIVWRFRIDPGDEGLTTGWHEGADTADASWQDIRVDDFWTEQGIKHHGVAWYATRFSLPAEAEGRLWLLFAMLDGAAEVWVDGRSAGKLPSDPWNKRKALDVTALVAPGKEMQLVIRVVKHNYAAGIPRPVRLMASPPAQP